MNEMKDMSLKVLPADYTVIDTETTGLSPFDSRMIEVSGIKVRNDMIVSTFSRLIDPETDISYFISKLTGITNEMVIDEGKLAEVLPEYIAFIGDDILLGHNVTFDINFINAASWEVFRRPFKKEYVDTMYISRRIWPWERHHRLIDLIERCQLGGEQEHRGLSDCMYTYRAYLRMKEILKMSEDQ
ncbi:MAG: 3'-5' exonuclease [Erysipelotrichaceae bacterium]|nr:3'-5' exonuclease [Erysipelotrichaceae bacterium]